MFGKHFKEHADFLKTIMNICILVSGALGSIVNLIKGNNVPMIISLVAVGVVIVFVLVEWKSRREEAAKTRATMAEMTANRGPSGAQAVPAGAPVPHPIVVPCEPAVESDRVYRDAHGQRVVRLVVARKECPT